MTKNKQKVINLTNHFYNIHKGGLEEKFGLDLKGYLIKEPNYKDYFEIVKNEPEIKKNILSKINAKVACILYSKLNLGESAMSIDN